MKSTFFYKGRNELVNFQVTTNPHRTLEVMTLTPAAKNKGTSDALLISAFRTIQKQQIHGSYSITTSNGVQQELPYLSKSSSQQLRQLLRLRCIPWKGAQRELLRVREFIQHPSLILYLLHRLTFLTSCEPISCGK